MSVKAQWFCDLCNSSRQVRDETNEVKHGFAEIEATDSTTLTQMPKGWSIVAEVPRTGVPGHACNHCTNKRELGDAIARGEVPGAAIAPEDRSERVRRRTSSGGAPVSGPGDWPSKASPFAADA